MAQGSKQWLHCLNSGQEKGPWQLRSPEPRDPSPDASKAGEGVGPTRHPYCARDGRCSHQTPRLPPKVSAEAGKIPVIKLLRCCTPQPSVHALRRLRVRSHRILAPESRGPHQRCGFSEPRLLHLPTQRKAVNFLTWDIWFCFINSHLLTFWLLGLCGKHPCISWLPPSPFRTVSQSYLRCWVPGLSPQFCPLNKT